MLTGLEPNLASMKLNYCIFAFIIFDIGIFFSEVVMEILKTAEIFV